MSENFAIAAFTLIICVGVAALGVLLGEGLLSVLRWFLRRRGLLPERTVKVTMPIYRCDDCARRAAQEEKP